MGRKVKACAKCTQKCLLVHGKKTKSSPFIPSFFKVMIGDRYSEVLFLPPKFAPIVSALIGQIALLEDSSGQQWELTVSDLNGSLVFQQGWNAFSLHHRLEIGDFVVFHYITGSHFLVNIYGKTGCEKLDFSENRSQRKRSRTAGNSTFKDVPCYTIDIGSMNKQGSNTPVISGSDVQISQSHCEVNDLEKAITKITSNCEKDNGRPRVSKSEYLEEPYYIIDRDMGDIQQEDRCPIFDLSYFEMLENTSDTNKSNKITVGGERHLHHYDASLRFQIEDVPVKKDSVDEKAVNGVVASDASDFEMMEKNNDFQTMDKRLTVSERISCNSKISEHILLTNAAEPQKYRGNSFNNSSGLFKRRDIAEEESKAQSKSRSEIDHAMVSQKKHIALTDNNQTDQLKLTGKFRESNVLVAPMLNSQLGGRMNMIKKETIEMSPEVCSDEMMIQDIYGKLPQVIKMDCGQSSDVIVRENAIQLVKSETLNLIPISSPVAANISCEIVSASQPFLELPTRLPTSSFTQRSKRGRMVLLLRDPYMRMWPVLYHESSEFKILTSGWEAFSKANNIQPGDECVFGVENEDEGIYRVNIVRK